MRKVFLFISLGAIMVSVFSSCAASKRDCQGVRHYKQKGGFYL